MLPVFVIDCCRCQIAWSNFVHLSEALSIVRVEQHCLKLDSRRTIISMKIGTLWQ